MLRFLEEAIIMYTPLAGMADRVQNYANVPLIVDIAERMGVHAVWAGWFAPQHFSITNDLGDMPRKIPNFQRAWQN